jgi:hypothetical protein
MTMAMEVIIIIFMLSKLGKYLITGGRQSVTSVVRPIYVVR